MNPSESVSAYQEAKREGTFHPRALRQAETRKINTRTPLEQARMVIGNKTDSLEQLQADHVDLNEQRFARDAAVGEAELEFAGVTRR